MRSYQGDLTPVVLAAVGALVLMIVISRLISWYRSRTPRLRLLTGTRPQRAALRVALAPVLREFLPVLDKIASPGANLGRRRQLPVDEDGMGRCLLLAAALLLHAFALASLPADSIKKACSRQRISACRMQPSARAPKGEAVANILQGFQDTSHSETAAMFEWLDNADRLGPIQDIKRRMLELRPPVAGESILDVGCGLGHEVMRLAELTGPSGRAVGIDKNHLMIAEACRRSAERRVTAEFAVSDAQRLELGDQSFDICRAERVLRYVDNPRQALGEIARVLRPGGHAVIFDFDSDQTVVDMPDQKLVRRIAEILDAAVPNPWIGRQLVRLCLEAGLVDLMVVPHAVLLRSPQFAVYRRLVGGTLSQAVERGALPGSELAAWWAWLEQAETRGQFFTATFGFVVRGRRP